MNKRVVFALMVTCAAIGFLLPSPIAPGKSDVKAPVAQVRIPTTPAPIAAPAHSLRQVHTPRARRVHTVHLNWPALARCESNNRAHAVSPEGTYRGLYQFDRETWASVGGTGDPAGATRYTQLVMAKRLYAERGRAPWPVCGAQL